jgi:ATP-dependent RNA helicase DeaD
VPAAAARRPRLLKPGQRAEGTWFRLTIGREKKADPRWLLPLLCRRGEVTRDEIGKIVVLANETRFEIAKAAAARFAKAARRPDSRMPGAHIEPSQKP